MKRLALVLAAMTTVMFACKQEIPEKPEEKTLDVFKPVQNEFVLVKGETAQVELESSIALKELEIDWLSSDTKVVSVSDGGLITAKSEGEAEVTAIVNKYGNEAVVKVTVAAVKVEISPASDTLAIADKLKFTTLVEPKDLPLVWTSSALSVAMVNQEGELTAVGAGIANIKAENEASKAAGASKILVADMKLTTKVASLVELSTSTFKVTTYPPVYDPEIIWESSDPAVATVSPEGVVTAVKAGKTTISATTACKPAIKVSSDLTVSIYQYFSSGEGTEASPFVIKTAAELKKWSDIANGTAPNPKEIDFTKAYFELGADIDMKSTSFAAIPTFSGSFDGKSHVIRNLTISEATANPLGFFREISDARIKDLSLSEINITSTSTTQLYVGSLAGKAENSTITNVDVTGVVVSAGKGTIPLGGSVVVSGGVVGQSTGCTIDGSDLRLYISSQGQYIGGVAGLCYGKTVIKNCKLGKGSELMCLMNNAGGIAGAILEETEVSDCECHGAVKGKYAMVGGIVGQVFCGSVKNCLVSSSASVLGDVGNATAADSYAGVGGVVGKINVTSTSKKAVIENCSVYCDVTANDTIGGIVGFTASAIDVPTAIVNCLYSGKLTALYKNNYAYSLAGGIVGWAGNPANAVLYIANCACIVKGIVTNIVAATSGCVGGLFGYSQNKNDITSCYSTITADQIVTTDGAQIATTSMANYGGLAGRSAGNASGNEYNQCYYSSAVKAVGMGASSQTLDNAYAVESLKEASVKTGLESGSSAFNARSLGFTASSWTTNTDGYFVPSTVKPDTNPGGGTPLKVSLIGDSISTFNGYLPTGYNTFYPTGDVVSASQTYWYRLIYNNMQNAVLEKNIAWTGTLVTRSLNTAMASQHWYGHDFNARFIKDGMGNPDVILVHGGTNDVSSRGYNEAQVKLYKSLATNGSAYPSDAEFAEVFAVVDAAATRVQLEALPDTTFVEAYTKLIALIHQQYPSAKVVMLIGDYLPEGARQSVLKIAAHYNSLYGYRVVDFVASNGFQSSKYITKATGCHPDSNGFKWMADQIYKEVGSYIEQ
ncbi:MAG: Ig-like domain-containing protein [Bacteroidales bacterium]|nr:Ig-like domain-containing protein [Bacteroidales bacterium]